MDVFTLIGFVVVLYLLVYIVCLSFTDCDLGLNYALHFGKKLDKLRGKVVWVTGASGGIGEAMAYCVARHGGKLVLSARRSSELEQVRTRCLELNSYLKAEDVLVLEMDITDTETHQRCFDVVVQHFGTLNILINNAGRSQRATWENIELDVDRQIFELNVFGVVSLSRIAVKYFNRKGKGQLAVTSSVAGVMGVPFSGSYTATKHAIHGYFESLRTEKLADKISITLLCPGPTFSGFLQESFTDTSGVKYGKSVTETDRRMPAERCAHLSLTAIVNKLDEAWMALFPILPLVYSMVYFPNVSRILAKYLGAQQFQKLRDSSSTNKTP